MAEFPGRRGKAGRKTSEVLKTAEVFLLGDSAADLFQQPPQVFPGLRLGRRVASHVGRVVGADHRDTAVEVNVPAQPPDLSLAAGQPPGGLGINFARFCV